jgi:hypothetical protein
MAFRQRYWATFSATGLSLLIAVPSTALGQTRQFEASHPNHAAHSRFLTPSAETGADAQTDLDNCRVHRVTGLPGSHQFAGDFIETIATDPGATDPDLIWGLTADLSDQVPFEDRAMYISKSTNRGATWTQVARLNSRYFDAAIGEGIFNGLTVAPGGTYFVIATQRGAFQVIPQPGASEPLVKPIAGPLVPSSPPKLRIAKKPGDPVRANVVGMTADGTHLIIGYGYFDLDPKLFSYRKDQNGSWVEDGPLPPPPTQMDLLSMQFDDPKNPNPGFVYLGTGDQVYLLNLHTKRWSLVDGVGPDSAIHGMSVVGGLHLAACWGIYNPAGPGMVRRVTTARFLLHRSTDETGSNLRAYSIDVDPLKPNREVVASLTGVYTTEDRGRTWTRISGLPEEEFRSAHINSDGTILVSGIAGTFLVNPFSDACSPQLHLRDK